ncbi:hypothetical protein [Lysobacter gummosus]
MSPLHPICVRLHANACRANGRDAERRPWTIARAASDKYEFVSFVR